MEYKEYQGEEKNRGTRAIKRKGVE